MTSGSTPGPRRRTPTGEWGAGAAGCWRRSEVGRARPSRDCALRIPRGVWTGPARRPRDAGAGPQPATRCSGRCLCLLSGRLREKGTVRCGQWPGRRTGQHRAWGRPGLWAPERGTSPQGLGHWLGRRSQAVHTRGDVGAHGSPPLTFAWGAAGFQISDPGDIFCWTLQEGVERPQEPRGPVTGHTAEGVPRAVNKGAVPMGVGNRWRGDSLRRGQPHPPEASFSTVLVSTLPPGPSLAAKSRISRCCSPELVSQTLTSREARINNYLRKVAQATAEGAQVPKHLIKSFLP